MLPYYLNVVIQKAYDAKSDRHYQHRNNFLMAHAVEDTNNKKWNQENNSAHCRCSCFLLVRLKSLFSLCLACLETSEHLNYSGPYNNCNAKRNNCWYQCSENIVTHRFILTKSTKKFNSDSFTVQNCQMKQLRFL